MAEKQSPEDKAAAMQEYRDKQQSIMELTAVLRFERLQREAEQDRETKQDDARRTLRPAAPRKPHSASRRSR